MKKIFLAFILLPMILSCSLPVFTENTEFINCEGTYALCTTARCNAVSGNQDEALCKCKVQTGLSLGTAECKEGVKDGLINSRYYPVKSLVICDNTAPWGSCLDASCKIQGDGKAECKCPVVNSIGSYVIVTDAYTSTTCDSGIISSATFSQEQKVTTYLESVNQLPYDYEILEPAESIFVPLANADDAFTIETPKISIGFNDGAPFEVTVALGATGIYMGNKYFQPPALGKSDPSYIGSSSQQLFATGGTYNGDWYKTTVDIYDQSNSQQIIAKAEVPVLALTSKTCASDETSCSPLTADQLANYYKFGVGFGQEFISSPQGTPDKNPFLNISWTSKGGNLPSAGFLVTSDHQGEPGFLLGLTGIYKGDFTQIKLQPLLASASSQWQTLPANKKLLTGWKNATATIEVNGVSGTGSVLFDTDFNGVGVGYLSPPMGAKVKTHQASDEEECGTCLDNGAKVKVSIPGNASASFSYNYTLGDSSNLLAPPEVEMYSNGVPFTTVSFHFYSGVDYYYDAERGFIGLKVLSSTSENNATFKPGLILDNVFQCAFKSIDAAMSATTADKVTLYSYPYTYRYYPATKSYVGISSGSSASDTKPASNVNTIYSFDPDGTSIKSMGSLGSWLAAAGCQ